MTRVTVKLDAGGGLYAYDCRDAVVEGSRVLVPGSWIPGHESAQEGTVTVLGSSYTGPAKSILRVL